ncbi:hypothetical protein Glove_230g192 [Diversispora epigaea]|uniref:TLDc domain-containing protein n=1 Tax=Diversispora epigaea TaxID=1348612 RepID=A0A397IKS8_9GLOM|nr:hypothetical protein Glove_230g192 [Diversispora epigaea]
MTLKATLQQCLPLIRYFHIPNSDVVNKIKPYKKILDKQLWNDLRQYLMLPNQPVESIILPPRLVLKQELPARVIGPYSSRNNPYEFQLILRGSKDGFTPRTFWDICDGHANTIVVTKVKGTDEIIGGIQNSILSRVKKESMALWYPVQKDIYGPIFGRDEFTMKSNVSDFLMMD